MQTGATADPAAAAAPATVTVPTGKRWLLLGIWYTGVMDANAANRRLTVTIQTDSTNADFLAINPANLTASQTVYVSFRPGAGDTYYTVGSNHYQQCSLGNSKGIELPAGADIVSAILSVQVGDDLGPMRYIYKEAPA